MPLSSYIAGLHLSENQILNGVGWTSTAGMFYLTWPGSEFKQKVEREAGEAVHMPSGNGAKIVSGIHAMALFIPAGTFLLSLPLNRFVLPEPLVRWMHTCLESWRRNDLDIQTSGIAVELYRGKLNVRERPKLVNTGPYALVRHPMYTCAIMTDLALAAMFWNWIPLVGAAIIAPTFAIKMPMEERVILENKEVGDAYREYKKQVPWRIIPYLW
ncbi:isoprenylcysteine carboxyl methyltransferase [Ceratobasidium sp. AG-Ba]|nr:isoprenylcysteine carboxyl methyltransferase [Ceratobasidium sp. AG-Ba]